MTLRVTRWITVLALLSALAVPAWGTLSAADETRLGKQVMSQVRPLGLTRNPALEAIGARLAKCTQRQDVTWHFFVVEGMKDYNAFAAPGGFVFISRPYFEKLNTDETAFVIGHEMAHVDLRHVEQEMKRAQQANLGNILLRVLTKSEVVGTAVDLGATAYVTHYSRLMERQADFTGYGFANKAGYDASAAVTALSKLGTDKESAWMTNIYGDHPLLSSREDQLAALGGKAPATGHPPPPSPQHMLNLGLQPLDPKPTVAVRILGPDGTRWEGAWRKSFTKLLHDRLTPLGFTIAGDDLMYKKDIGDPLEATRSKKAAYLLLVTVKEMSSQRDEAHSKSEPITAALDDARAVSRRLERKGSVGLRSQGHRERYELAPHG